MSNGYYLLARFTNSEKLLPAVKLLSEVSGIIRWDAVDGQLHLVVRTDDNVQASVVRFTALDEYAHIKTARLLSDDPRKNVSNNSTLRAYLFVEVEPRYRESVHLAVATLPGILSCAATEGPCDIVALMTGPTLSAIDRVIEEQVRPMDGVLRVKRDRVINLEQL